MERILKQALHLHFEKLDVISPAQHGFRRTRPCITNLPVAREKWAKSMDASHRLDVVFVDFSKEFDRVPPKRLLNKLRQIGIGGNLLAWIADFLDDCSMRAKVNEVDSGPVLMTSGVPQGSILGPKLFKIFSNDPLEMLQIDCLICADDLKLWSEVSRLEDADKLQPTRNQLHDWSIK